MPPTALRRFPGSAVLWLVTAWLVAGGATPALAFVDDDAGPEPMTPVIGVEPPNLNFSRCLAPGLDCEDRVFKVFNDVQDPSSVLEVMEMTLIAGAGYTLIGPSPPFSIPGDGTRISFTVRFCPETGLPTPGAITITAHLAANSPLVFALSGDANQPPSCDTGGPYVQPFGVPLVFDARQSSDPDLEDEIVSYQWDFGDGSTGTGVQPAHLYGALGEYEVHLTVIDGCEVASSCTTTVTIIPGNLPPVCDTGGPYNGVTNVPIQFDGRGSSDPDGVITNYAWSFGDGTLGSGATPTHTYPVGGTFTVTLTVTDNDGGRSSCATSAVVVTNLPPTCHTGGPYQGVAGVPIELNGSGSLDPDGVITLYRWEFGDGVTATGAIVTHTYALAGNYTVRLFVFDNRGAFSSCTTTAMIVANLGPVCDAGGPYTAAVGAAVQFDGTGSFDPDGTIVHYAWNFGDGSQATGAAPTHSYASPGDYLVELCVRDNHDFTRCCTVTAHVFGAGSPLTPVIGVEPSLLDFGNCNGVGTPVELPIEIFNDVFDPTSILRLTSVTVVGPDFELSGGPNLPVDIPGNGSRVFFIVRFTAPGPLLTSSQLEIVAAQATNSPRSVPLQGRGNLAPVCDAGGPYVGNTGQPIDFDGTGSQDPGGITLAYRWDFGDGVTGTGATPTHTYTTAGTFTVTLTVTDNCAVASTCTTTASIQGAPICNAGGPYQGSPGIPVQFTGLGSHDPDGVIVSYAWTFGDGATGTGATPTHTYSVQGGYTIGLTVVDDDGLSSTCQSFAFIGFATPVEIHAFRAAARPEAVEVVWSFATRGDFLGFELWRGQAGEPEILLHDGLLADEDGDGAITFIDRRVVAGRHYEYALVAVDRGGVRERTGPLTVDVPLPDLALRIAPNPSRPPIAVTADLPAAGPVRVWVADATGRIVRKILDEPRAAGVQALRWDGRDGRGVAVASGIYFTILEQGNEVRKEKLVLVR